MNMIVRRDEAGPVYLRDVAEVIETYKEKTDWARARGHQMPFFNFLLQRGGNLIATMDRIKAEIAEMNAPGGVLAQHARQLGIKGELELVQVYDATTYVRDAIKLVQSNIVYGGILATLLAARRFLGLKLTARGVGGEIGLGAGIDLRFNLDFDGRLGFSGNGSRLQTRPLLLFFLGFFLKAARVLQGLGPGGAFVLG